VSEVVVEIEDISSVKKKMSLKVPWNEIQDELDSVYQVIGKKAKIKGFRPGKVPRKILETYYEAQAKEETITNIVNKYYWQTLEDKGIIAVSRPEISQEGIKENTDFTFSASFETEPEFEPDHYKGMELEKEAIHISEDDVQKRIDEIRQMFATIEEVKEDRPAVKGDYVVIDFTGTLNGESHKELNANDHFLEIGSEKFVPGFEDQLIGIKKGETGEIKVTFPSDYHDGRFAGQEVIFNVSVKSIREKKLPENNDDLIKNFDKYDSFEDFREDIRKTLGEKAQIAADTAMQDSITEKLIKANEFEVPQTMIDRQIYFMLADTQRRMVSAGIDEDSAIDFSLKMRDKYKINAENIVRSFLILKRIAQKESLVVDNDDIEKYIREMALQNGRDYEAVKEMYASEERREYIKIELIQKKVFDFIQQNANIKTVEKSANVEA
jgi:trigger factor